MDFPKQADMPESKREAEPKRFRVVATGHEYAAEQEESGGLTEPSQAKVSKRVIWSGSAADASKVDFEDTKFPLGYTGEPSDGDVEYSYSLQVNEDGEWKPVRSIDSDQSEAE